MSAAERAVNQARQVRLYGLALAEVVPEVAELLNLSQAQLARVLGVSPPMLSQLVSGRRGTIADPTALTRLRVLHGRCSGRVGPLDVAEREALLATVVQLRWTLATRPRSA